MKTTYYLTFLLFIFVGVISCKKVEGPKGEIGPAGASGPEAKTFNFNLTFTSSDTFKTYSGVIGYDEGDVVLTFVKYENINGTGYWVQTPLIVTNTVNIFSEFSENSGLLFVNTLKADGTSGSPWASSVTLDFKAVLIKSSGLIKHPNVDLSNYEEVEQAFDL